MVDLPWRAGEANLYRVHATLDKVKVILYDNNSGGSRGHGHHIAQQVSSRNMEALKLAYRQVEKDSVYRRLHYERIQLFLKPGKVSPERGGLFPVEPGLHPVSRPNRCIPGPELAHSGFHRLSLTA